MKVKFLIGFTILLLLFLCIGCQKKDTVHSVEKSKTESARTEELPYSFEINGKTLSLNSVDTYEAKTDSGYHLYIVTELDVASLAEDQIRQMRDDDLLCVDVDITSEDNKIDDEYAMILGSLYYTDTKKLVYVHMSNIGLGGVSSEPYLHSFIDSAYTVSISLKDETYDIPNYYLFCRGTVTKTLDPETISKPLHDYIVKWLNDKAEFWANMSN